MEGEKTLTSNRHTVSLVLKLVIDISSPIYQMGLCLTQTSKNSQIPQELSTHF